MFVRLRAAYPSPSRFSASRGARIKVEIRASLRRTLNMGKKGLGGTEFLVQDVLSSAGKGNYSSSNSPINKC
jgi:hypothetical protein